MHNLETLYQLALRITGDQEAAQVIAAVIAREGGLHGGVGDVRGGGSFGPLQFYTKGQLPNFARWLGVNPAQAARIAQDPNQWDKVIRFAWETYLGNAIRTGRSRGLTGSELAIWASQTGQRSINPQLSGQRFAEMFGGTFSGRPQRLQYNYRRPVQLELGSLPRELPAVLPPSPLSVRDVFASAGAAPQGQKNLQLLRLLSLLPPHVRAALGQPVRDVASQIDIAGSAGPWSAPAPSFYGIAPARQKKPVPPVWRSGPL